MGRSRAPALVLALVGLSIAACLSSCRQPVWHPPPTTNAPGDSVLIRFSDATLRPGVAQVFEGGRVTWVNDASSKLGSIFLSEALRAGLLCEGDLRPAFARVAGGYESRLIRRLAAQTVTLPCPLEPGEYDYEVRLHRRSHRDRNGFRFDPIARIAGRIVVLPAPTSPLPRRPSRSGSGASG